MSLREYNQLRSVMRKFSEKIPQIYDMGEVLPQIIRALGIGQGKTFVLEDEEELNFLIDFCLHEFLSNGQTLLERYRSDQPNLEPVEITYLDAAKVSYTSLFKITEVNPSASTITVVDLLSKSEQLLPVINVNLSKTVIPGYIIFSRLLPYEQFNTFSGMLAAFDRGSERDLLKRYKVIKKRIKSERESVQRFVTCFKLKRILGETILMRSSEILV